MEHYGVILRQLRLLNKLDMRAAAARIGRSSGWISEIENNKGTARLSPPEFERIVAAYGGEPYRKQFSIWIAQAHRHVDRPRDASYDGAILKYLRKKAQMSLGVAATEVSRSPGYLSLLENGVKPISSELRNKLIQLYGYSPSSFKNFATEDKRAKNIPTRYKLEILLNQLGEAKIEKIFSYAASILNESEFGLSNQPSNTTQKQRKIQLQEPGQENFQSQSSGS